MNRQKCWLLMIGISAWVTSVTGQVTLSLQVPPAGVMQKTQLWNMVLVYTGNTSVNVYVNLSLIGAKDNRTLMTAVTRSITLTKGAKLVGLNDLMPVQYNYLSPSFNVDRSPDGFLPLGNYRACYTVYRMESDAVQVMAEDCIPVEVQPLGPPMLNNPADGDTLQNGYPQFTWLPAVPTSLFTNLNYELLLVEVMNGQTRGDAIQKNLPVYTASYCTTPFNNYPSSNASLDTGKTYAWKVIAKNESEPVAQSEVWTFRIKGNTVKTTNSNTAYVVLKDELQGVYTLQADTLKVKYFSFEKTFNATVSFKDETGQLVTTQQQRVAQGDNYFDFAIGNRFTAGRTYVVSLKDQNGQQHSLRFTLTKKQ